MCLSGASVSCRKGCCICSHSPMHPHDSLLPYHDTPAALVLLDSWSLPAHVTYLGQSFWWPPWMIREGMDWCIMGAWLIKLCCTLRG